MLQVMVTVSSASSRSMQPLKPAWSMPSAEGMSMQVAGQQRGNQSLDHGFKFSSQYVCADGEMFLK